MSGVFNTDAALAAVTDSPVASTIVQRLSTDLQELKPGDLADLTLLAMGKPPLEAVQYLRALLGEAADSRHPIWSLLESALTVNVATAANTAKLAAARREAAEATLALVVRALVIGAGLL